jgi:hypothetical protein
MHNLLIVRDTHYTAIRDLRTRHPPSQLDKSDFGRKGCNPFLSNLSWHEFNPLQPWLRQIDQLYRQADHK